MNLITRILKNWKEERELAQHRAGFDFAAGTLLLDGHSESVEIWMGFEKDAFARGMAEALALWRRKKDAHNMLIQELQHHTERGLQLHTTLDTIVPRLESACGRSAMPPTMIRQHIADTLKNTN